MSQLRAFILAAGLGQRLRPLTNIIPKPLIPVFHKPLITFALDHLLSLGIDEIGINTRYLWKSFYQAFNVEPTTTDRGVGMYENHPLQFFKESSHLDTGGGLRNAHDFLKGKPFLLHNGDILSNIPLEALLERHRSSGAIATLLLREEGGALNVCCDETTNCILDIRGDFTHHPQHPVFLYTGIAVVESMLMDFIKPEGPASLIDALLDAMKAGHCVGGFVSREGFWNDLGTPEAYLQTHFHIIQHDWKFPFQLQGAAAVQWPTALHPTAKIDPSAILQRAIVGPHACVEAYAKVTDSILLPGAHVPANTKNSRAIILPLSI